MRYTHVHDPYFSYIPYCEGNSIDSLLNSYWTLLNSYLKLFVGRVGSGRVGHAATSPTMSRTSTAPTSGFLIPGQPSRSNPIQINISSARAIPKQSIAILIAVAIGYVQCQIQTMSSAIYRISNTDVGNQQAWNLQALFSPNSDLA